MGNTVKARRRSKRPTTLQVSQNGRAPDSRGPVKLRGHGKLEGTRRRLLRIVRGATSPSRLAAVGPPQDPSANAWAVHARFH
jgi:hypothetical protein